MDALKLTDVIAMVNGRLTGLSSITADRPGGGPDIQSISSDSRQLRQGSLFIALPGDNYDGHNYLPQAAAAGAVAALVERIPAAWPTDLLLIQVHNTRRAMGQIAAELRRRSTSKVIAVGGSNGKTGTKHLIDSALCQRLRGTFSPKSFNNDIGVPLAIFAADPSQDYLVLELGTNHPGEISVLTNIAKPDIAVITNCAAEHLEGLGDLEGVRREEASIVEGLVPGGLLVVNGDDPALLPVLRDIPNRITFGHDSSNNLFATNIRCGFDGVEFLLNGKQRIFVPLLGRHTAINALAAIAVARHMGLSDADIIQSLAQAHGPEMRLEVHTLGSITIINDAYNANPASMQAALETLAALPCQGRRVAVLGEMRELGEWTEELHRDMGRFVAENRPDLLICVGPVGSIIGDEACRGGFPAERFIRFEDTPAAASAIPQLASSGDLILLKASRGIRMELIAQAFTTEPIRKTA